MTPVLWGRGSSSNVQKVIFAAHEIGLVFEHRIVGGPFGGTDTDAYGALNPNRKIPVWQDADGAHWESHAILRHLARKHDSLYGRSVPEQAAIDRWLDWSSTTFWPPVRLLYQKFPQKGCDPTEHVEGEAALVDLRRNLQIASGLVAGPSGLVAGAFSIADIPLAIMVNRMLGMQLGVELPAPLAEWWAAASRRPAFALAVADEPSGQQ